MKSLVIQAVKFASEHVLDSKLSAYAAKIRDRHLMQSIYGIDELTHFLEL